MSLNPLSKEIAALFRQRNRRRKRWRRGSRNGGSDNGPEVDVDPAWVDSGAGYATVTLTGSFAAYWGLDYGTSSGIYTSSALAYVTPGNPASGLYFGTTPTILVPETGTMADGTYYFAVAAGDSSYNSYGYVFEEQTGTISTESAILLAVGGSDFLLLAAGGSDKLLRAA